MEKELKIPKISEDADEATVAELLVSKGDTIEKGQAILTVESDKANVEIPADFAGKITGIKVSEGDNVSVGDVVMTLEVENEGSDSEQDEPEKEKSPKNKEASQQDSEAQVEEDKDEAAREHENKKAKTNDKASQPETDDSQDEEKETQDAGFDKADEEVPVAPLARKFARELGITLNEVPTAGERLTREDVTSYVKKLIGQRKGASGEANNALSLPDFSKWGETERKPFSGIRKATAKNTLQSWQHIPHVTQNDKANVSGLEAFIKKQNEKSEEKITITAIILKIMGEALKEFPEFNASLDMEKEEIVYKKYYNVGVAVDTEKGLLLPVIRNIREKSIEELAKELSDVAEKAREGKLTAAEMKGGNFTISNLGGIGGTGFTPVIFPPQVAILGVSRTQTEAIYKGGVFEPEKMLPLSLSYDHRIIDGANAARFLRWICASLEQPIRLMLH